MIEIIDGEESIVMALGDSACKTRMKMTGMTRAEVYQLRTEKRTNGDAKKETEAPLSMPDLKKAVYDHFGVKNGNELKKSNGFGMATDGMDFKASDRASWEKVHRKFIGVLPEEKNAKGVTVVNGVDVVKYFKPWQTFGLDGATATNQDIKDAYRKLSKVYHPDNKQTGNAQVFEKLTIAYKSITAGSGGSPKKTKKTTAASPTPSALKRQLSGN